MWDIPGPGLELVSPALAGGFLTTSPPRKPPRPMGLNIIENIKFIDKVTDSNIFQPIEFWYSIKGE